MTPQVRVKKPSKAVGIAHPRNYQPSQARVKQSAEAADRVCPVKRHGFPPAYAENSLKLYKINGCSEPLPL